MGPMLSPSPILLDHSFPRDEAELNDITTALGNLQQICNDGGASILSTPVFPDYVANLDWSEISNRPRLHDIFRYLTAIFLQPNMANRIIDTDRLPTAPEHPLPLDCDDRDDLHLWGLELGKVLQFHDSLPGPKPFVGVACHRGFSGGSTSVYADVNSPAFPLVGLSTYQGLESATYWETRPTILQQPVRYRDALRNLRLLGGRVSPEAVGSHYTVHFAGAPRPWVLDANIDPVSENYLRQLPLLVQKPMNYIKEVLIYGEVPELKDRFGTLIQP
jgi:hypothetical protein